MPFKTVFDEENRLITTLWLDVITDQELENAIKECKAIIEKHPERQLSYLANSMKQSMKFAPPKHIIMLFDFLKYLTGHTKKASMATPSLMLRKSCEMAFGKYKDNCRFFASDQEAMKWLREK